VTWPAPFTSSGGIDGIVVDASSGAPVANASVFVVAGPAPVADIAAVTSDDGRFVLDLPTGAWRIRAVPSSGRPADLLVDVAAGSWTAVRLEVGVPAS